MKLIKGGGVTTPNGFLASAVSCGIKKSGQKDLALLVSIVPSVCRGTFTTNRFKSGSVLLSEGYVKKGKASAVIVNSGNANCCVGEKGLKDAEDITDSVAQALDTERGLVLIASTGIIGKVLPVDRIKNKIGFLVKRLKKIGGREFAKAIMTTDTVHKEIAVKVKLGGEWVIIGGAVKGSGMICPNMATMLAFFTTDVSIETNALKSAFKECINNSFNRITVDGDMSTNDSAFILANGLAGNTPIIKKGCLDYFKFLDSLKFVSCQLAKKVVLDGEGATKFVEVLVKRARSLKEADMVARQVGNSILFKTMIAGGDPNWGRIAASIGASGVKIDREKVCVCFGKKLVMRNGAGTEVSKKFLSDIANKKELQIIIDLKSGKESARIWTCDLTEDYVKINAEYET